MEFEISYHCPACGIRPEAFVVQAAPITQPLQEWYEQWIFPPALKHHATHSPNCKGAKADNSGAAWEAKEDWSGILVRVEFFRGAA